jgi:hypothetical protein
VPRDLGPFVELVAAVVKGEVAATDRGLRSRRGAAQSIES